MSSKVIQQFHVDEYGYYEIQTHGYNLCFSKSQILNIRLLKHSTAWSYPLSYLCHRKILYWPLSDKKYQILGTCLDTINNDSCALCTGDKN